MRQKPVDFCYCIARALTLVSAIILLIQVPQQQFPFLFSLQFLEKILEQCMLIVCCVVVCKIVITNIEGASTLSVITQWEDNSNVSYKHCQPVSLCLPSTSIQLCLLTSHPMRLHFSPLKFYALLLYWLLIVFSKVLSS